MKHLVFALSTSLCLLAQAPPPGNNQQQTSPAQGTSTGPGTVSESEQQRRDLEREQQRLQNSQNSKSYRRESVPRLNYVQGKVLMSGGGMPPDEVTVRIVCSGRGAQQVSTDTKGNFGIPLGNFPDPVSAPGLGRESEGLVRDCELQAMLPGFRSTAVSIASVYGQLSSARYTLILHPIDKVEGFTFSATSLLAPKEAKKAFEKGRQSLQKQRFAEAERELRRAAVLHPKYAAAWYELGRAMMLQHKQEDARSALEQAARCDSRYISPYPMLAQIALNEKRWTDLADHTSYVIKLNPYFSADIYFYSALANLNLQRIDLAEKHAREAINMDERNRLPMAHQMLGHILAQRGQLRESVTQLRLYLSGAPGAADAAAVGKQLAALESLLAESK